MTASSTVTSICNRALLSLGARATISSLSEGSTESDACSILFQPTYEALARSAPWNCLRNQAALTLLAAASGTPENPDGTTLPLPPDPWLYQYAVPSNSLDIRFIVPTTNSTSTGTSPLTTASVTAGPWIPAGGAVPFVVAYATDSSNNPLQVILCNLSQAQAVYTVNQANPVIFDSLFEQALVSALAAYLVPALSLNLPLMQMAIKTADAAIAMARVRDGDEGITSMNRNASWMTARMTGALYGDNSDGYTPWLLPEYTGMAWPSY